MTTDDYVVVGRIGPAHGIRGDVFVEPRTDEPDRRFAVGARFETPRGTFTVASQRLHQQRLLIHFEELADRTAAETARGVELRCVLDPAETPDDPDEFYDHQLIGLVAHRDDGRLIGPVTSLVHGAQDLLVIDAGGRDVLVPFVEALVPEIDLAARRLTVADRPGLIDDLDHLDDHLDEQ